MILTTIAQTFLAILIQIAFGLATNDWTLGGTIACVWWWSREHVQAEYRWIEEFGGETNSTQSYLGGFHPKVWSLTGSLGFIVPMLACLVFYHFTEQLQYKYFFISLFN